MLFSQHPVNFSLFSILGPLKRVSEQTDWVITLQKVGREEIKNKVF